MDPRTRLLLEAPIGPTIIRLALPNMAVMLAQAAIGLIETYFIAKLGLDALAGVALVFPLFMLLQMVSAGAMGGGILSAVARALGAGRHERVTELVWAATFITILLGAVTTAVALLFAPQIYATMGGSGASLAAASQYSAIVFAGAVPLWLFNSFAAVIRATGNMRLPAVVIIGGALVLVPLSPLLIFGIGPFPQLGIAGGATAVVLYYVVGAIAFAIYIWGGYGPVKPSVAPPRIGRASYTDILRVGAASSLVSLSTNATAALSTGLAGIVGPAAVAGYGTGVRLEYLLVPLVFGLGAPLAAIVGTNIGAGRRDRAMKAAWIGAAIAAAFTEAIGIAAALFPTVWLSLFAQDKTMLAVGSDYLRIVGPFYGFFGGGLALYFASQGAGRVTWAVVIAIARVAIAAVGGWIGVTWYGSSNALFVALSAAIVVYGVGNAASVLRGAGFDQAEERGGVAAPAKA